MDNDIRLEVRSDPRFLGTIRNVVRGWVDSYGVSGDRADEVMLAIDEACSNVIRHAYEGRCHHTVELTLQSDDEYLEFRVCDEGIPCPPEHVERRPLEPPDPDELKPGGLGVQLMYEVFDDVEFSHGAKGGNCVVLRLKRQP
jgi:anti-sigma regulatory factor (Ser/Thr protein kinase)